MFLRAGALSLALLLASRLLGVVRESALAAAFGRSALADVAILLLTLPDWITSVALSGALAYVLLPAWSRQTAGEVAVGQRRVAGWCLAAGLLVAAGLVLSRHTVLAWLAGGLPAAWRPLALQALAWSAVAVPAAMLAAVWTTRLQHERDFGGVYGANLVVNLLLIATLVAAGVAPNRRTAVPVLGVGLLLAMGARLLWLRWRLPPRAPAPPAVPALPAPAVWLWAVLSAGLPLALPFAARSAAAQAGEGALASFNYAWKLVELPLILAIQLVASLAFPAVARALAEGEASEAARTAIRQAFVLAWTLACAAVAGLALGGDALARLLFGWGRMPAAALQQVAGWGVAGSWSLLPQALAAVALTVLATQHRMAAAVAGYALALLAVLGAASAGVHDGLALMHLLNAGYLLVALACLRALGPQRTAWLPWPALGWGVLGLAAALLLARPLQGRIATLGVGGGLAAGAAAAGLVLVLGLWRSSELRQALRR